MVDRRCTCHRTTEKITLQAAATMSGRWYDSVGTNAPVLSYPKGSCTVSVCCRRLGRGRGSSCTTYRGGLHSDNEVQLPSAATRYEQPGLAAIDDAAARPRSYRHSHYQVPPQRQRHVAVAATNNNASSTTKLLTCRVDAPVLTPSTSSTNARARPSAGKEVPYTVDEQKEPVRRYSSLCSVTFA